MIRVQSTRSVVSLATVASVASACIISDYNIEIEGEFANRGAVRILENFNVGPSADDACGESLGLNQCPVPDQALHPGLLPIPFCVCPEGFFDSSAPNSFNIFVEDPDRNEDNNPLDEIRGAFFLDLNPVTDNLEEAQPDYRQYLDPSRVARLDLNSAYVDSIGRPPPQPRILRVFGSQSQEQGVDLCNGAGTLETGFHTLHLIVSDRDWFTTPGPDGGPGNQLPGVPDLARGATYDSATYVFNCGEGEQCNCSPVDEP